MNMETQYSLRLVKNRFFRNRPPINTDKHRLHRWIFRR